MKLTGIYEHKKSLQWDGHLSEKRDERLDFKNKRGRVANKVGCLIQGKWGSLPPETNRGT